MGNDSQYNSIGTKNTDAEDTYDAIFGGDETVNQLEFPVCGKEYLAQFEVDDVVDASVCSNSADSFEVPTSLIAGWAAKHFITFPSWREDCNKTRV